MHDSCGLWSDTRANKPDADRTTSPAPAAGGMYTCARSLKKQAAPLSPNPQFAEAKEVCRAERGLWPGSEGET